MIATALTDVWKQFDRQSSNVGLLNVSYRSYNLLDGFTRFSAVEEHKKQ